MWVVIHSEKMSIFAGYDSKEKAERACNNLNTVKEKKFYMEFVEVRQMAIVTKTLTFEGKRAGSVVENPNIAYLNDVELTQTQYDQIYGSELRVTETDVLKFKFVIPNDAILPSNEIGRAHV